MRMEWTLDTYVLYKIAELQWPAIDFAMEIRRHKDIVTFDYDGHILCQYRRCLKDSRMLDGNGFLKKWLKGIIDTSAQIFSGKLTKRQEMSLNKLKFDRSDRPFIAVCACTNSKKLVSEDSDYTREVRTYLKSTMKISILSIEEALNIARG
jgi:hypothetical protein